MTAPPFRYLLILLLSITAGCAVQRDKFEAEQQQTITALQSKAAALVDALERIGDTACGEASHQYIALTALAALL